MKSRSIPILFLLMLLPFSAVADADDDSILAEGTFWVFADLNTLVLTPKGDNRCLITVSGKIMFAGTLRGDATGTTRALVFAPCAAALPPGIARDVFRSKLKFEGYVNGTPVTADLVYTGITKPPGDIKARMIFSNGLEGVLLVDAFVLVGGDYAGFIEIEDDD